MHRSKFATFLLSLLIVATLALDTRGQAVFGSISGTVTDPSGAAIVGATVTVTELSKIFPGPSRPMNQVITRPDLLFLANIKLG